MFKIFLTAMAVSTLSFANTIVLQPGESRVLKLLEETTVVCQAGGEVLIDKFCNCRDSGPQYMVNLLKHYIYTGGKETVVELGRYYDSSQCETALAANPACK